MLIFQLILFFLISLISLITFAGYGQILISNYKKNFLESTFFGFLVLGFVVTGLHFFIKISIFLTTTIIIVGLFLALKNYFFLIKKIKKETLIFLLIFLLLTPIYISQKYHEDLGYYHLPYIINLHYEKIIFGLANSNTAFLHNSIWLNIMSLFYTKYSFDFITVPTFLLYFVFIIFFLKETLYFDKKNLSHYLTIISLFYFILKFTRISEFGNDLPAVLFSILSIFFFFKFNECKSLNDKLYSFFCNFSFALFAVLIKFSCIPVILLTIYLLSKNFSILKKEIFKLNYFIVYFLGLFFFIQQFIYSGCFLFPSKFSCLEVSWFNVDFLSLSERLQVINKSYSEARHLFTKEEFLNDFNWLPFWFQRNYPEILEHLFTMILPLILLFLILKRDVKKKQINFKEKSIFIFFLIVGFTFWLNFSPVYRFGVVYFLIFIFLATIFIYKTKNFSKRVFLSLVFISLVFNFTKNTLRISKEHRIFLGIKKIQNNFYKYPNSQSNFVSVYKPDIKKNMHNGWQGRLCWDITFLCSHNEINVNKMYSYLIINKSNN